MGAISSPSSGSLIRWTDDLGHDWQGMEVRSRSDVERVQMPLADVLVLARVLGYPPDRHLVGFNQATDERGLSPFPTVPILSDLNSLMPDTLFIQQRSKLLCTCLASGGYEVSHTGGGNRGGSRAGAVRTDIR
jgi:hypothetical protein